MYGRELFVQELFAGADPAYRLKARFVNEKAWHNMFVLNQFVASERENFAPDFTEICVPGLKLDPKVDGTHSDAFIGVNFTRRIVLIVGTGYAGEMKKSIFATLNCILPQQICRLDAQDATGHLAAGSLFDTSPSAYSMRRSPVQPGSSVAQSSAGVGLSRNESPTLT